MQIRFCENSHSFLIRSRAGFASLLLLHTIVHRRHSVRSPIVRFFFGYGIVMEPTEAEIETFHTVEDLARWAGMTGEVDNPQSSVGSFFTLMGFAKQEHWRTMAILADSDLDNILNNWNTQRGSMFMKASPAQLAQARLLSLAAKVKGRKPHCKRDPKKIKP